MHQTVFHIHHLQLSSLQPNLPSNRMGYIQKRTQIIISKLTFKQNGISTTSWGRRNLGTFLASSIRHLTLHLQQSLQPNLPSNTMGYIQKRTQIIISKLTFKQNGISTSSWGRRNLGTFSASSIRHLNTKSSLC